MVDGLLKPRTKPISLISLIVSLDPPNPTKVGFVGLRTWCVAKVGHFQINYNIYIPVRITAPSVDYNLILYNYREKYFIILHLHLILNYLSCTYKMLNCRQCAAKFNIAIPLCYTVVKTSLRAAAMHASRTITLKIKNIT